jgi:hypothetical protein
MTTAGVTSPFSLARRLSPGLAPTSPRSGSAAFHYHSRPFARCDSAQRKPQAVAAGLPGRCRYVRRMSGEPANFNLLDLAYWESRRRPQRRPSGPRPTLGQLQRLHPWCWLHCERCQHKAPMAFAPLVIRWGADTSSDQLRRCARCTRCGNKGATLQHTGWAGEHIGFAPWPDSEPLPEKRWLALLKPHVPDRCRISRRVNIATARSNRQSVEMIGSLPE